MQLGLRVTTWAPVAVMASLIVSLLLVSSEVAVWAMPHDNSSLVDFSDLLFGVSVNPEGVGGCLTEADATNVCHPLMDNSSLDAIVLFQRSDCVARAGFQATRTHEVDIRDRDLQRRRVLRSVFGDEATSRNLRVIVHCDKGAHTLLLPEATSCPQLDCHSVLDACWVLGRALALVVCTLLASRSLWLWLRARWARPMATKSPPSQKAQVRIFSRLSDLCAICLDDYEEGDRLKILPCSHAYHCRCIEPWLSMATRRSCPLCKQSVASTQDGSTVDSFGDDEPAVPGLRPPIWALQACLRSRRLELLARASPCHQYNVTSVGSSNGSPGPS